MFSSGAANIKQMFFLPLQVGKVTGLVSLRNLLETTSAISCNNFVWKSGGGGFYYRCGSWHVFTWLYMMPLSLNTSYAKISISCTKLHVHQEGSPGHAGMPYRVEVLWDCLMQWSRKWQLGACFLATDCALRNASNIACKMLPFSVLSRPLPQNRNS